MRDEAAVADSVCQGTSRSIILRTGYAQHAHHAAVPLSQQDNVLHNTTKLVIAETFQIPLSQHRGVRLSVSVSALIQARFSHAIANPRRRWPMCSVKLGVATATNSSSIMGLVISVRSWNIWANKRLSFLVLASLPCTRYPTLVRDRRAHVPRCELARPAEVTFCGGMRRRVSQPLSSLSSPSF